MLVWAGALVELPYALYCCAGPGRTQVHRDLGLCQEDLETWRSPSVSWCLDGRKAQTSTYVGTDSLFDTHDPVCPTFTRSPSPQVLQRDNTSIRTGLFRRGHSLHPVWAGDEGTGLRLAHSWPLADPHHHCPSIIHLCMFRGIYWREWETTPVLISIYNDFVSLLYCIIVGVHSYT